MRRLSKRINVCVMTLGLLTAVAACQTAKPQPSASKPAPSRSVAWKLGSRYVYSLDMRSAAVVGADESKLDFTLTAQLVLEPLRVEGKSTELGIALESPRFTSQRPDPDGGFAALAKEITAPGFFSLESGKLTQLQLRPTLSPFASSIVRSLVAALQIADVPSTGGTWSARENDATGSYTAEYKLGAEPGVLSKRKLAYDPIKLSKLVAGSALAKQPTEVTPKVESTEGALSLDPSGQLTRLLQDERIAVSLMGGSPVQSHTRLELKLVPAATPAARDWHAARAATVKVSPGQALPAAPVSDAELDRARIGNLTFASALLELEKAENDPETQRLRVHGDSELDEEQRSEREAYGRGQAKVFSGLAALFRQKPESVDLATAKIKSGSVADKALLDALGSAHSAPAEKALIALATDLKLAPELRKKAGSSLIRIRQPSEEAVSALERLLNDPLLNIHASYGLGSFSRRLREVGQIERSTRISDLLQQRLKLASGPTAKQIALRSIANSAHTGALAAVTPYLTDPNASIRLGAVQALRLMEHPEATALIAARLNDDKSAKVRIAALEAAGRKTPSPTLRTVVATIAREAPDAQSRLNAVKLLQSWLPEAPELRESLGVVAKNEREPQIRNLAEKALAP